MRLVHYDQAALPVIRPFLELAHRFGQAWRYRPSASDIASFWAPARTSEEQDRPPFVGENGTGLPLVLQRLQGQNRNLFQAIEQRYYVCMTSTYVLVPMSRAAEACLSP